MDNDQQWMARALVQAERSIGLASPNPAVGCVLVLDDRVVGEGFHAYDLRDHAEVVALRQAGSQARGATAYVTLEPCTHYGRTGPCVDALLAAGVRSVVVAAQDPNPVVHGEGIAMLRAAGVEVRTHEHDDEHAPDGDDHGEQRQVEQRQPCLERHLHSGISST